MASIFPKIRHLIVHFQLNSNQGVTFGTFAQAVRPYLAGVTKRGALKMQATLHRLFLSHPQTVDESFGEHFLFALGFALRLFGAGLAALIHAIVPCLFEKTASRMIREMHDKITSRAHQPANRDATSVASVAG
jgi:hypothetical protein